MSEKLIVHEGDIPHTDEPVKPRYPKNLDVGRIVFEEAPEEKEPMTKHDVQKRDEVKETHDDMETSYKVERGLTTQVKQDVVGVGWLNVIDYGGTPKQSERVEEMVKASYTEKPRKFQKVP